MRHGGLFWALMFALFTGPVMSDEHTRSEGRTGVKNTESAPITWCKYPRKYLPDYFLNEYGRYDKFETLKSALTYCQKWWDSASTRCTGVTYEPYPKRYYTLRKGTRLLNGTRDNISWKICKPEWDDKLVKVMRGYAMFWYTDSKLRSYELNNVTLHKAIDGDKTTGDFLQQSTPNNTDTYIRLSMQANSEINMIRIYGGHFKIDDAYVPLDQLFESAGVLNSSNSWSKCHLSTSLSTIPFVQFTCDEALRRDIVYLSSRLDDLKQMSFVLNDIEVYGKPKKKLPDDPDDPDDKNDKDEEDETNDEPNTKKKLSATAIIFIVVACVAVVLGLTVFTIKRRHKQKQKRQRRENGEQPNLQLTVSNTETG